MVLFVDYSDFDSNQHVNAEQMPEPAGTTAESALAPAVQALKAFVKENKQSIVRIGIASAVALGSTALVCMSNGYIQTPQKDPEPQCPWQPNWPQIGAPEDAAPKMPSSVLPLHNRTLDDLVCPATVLPLSTASAQMIGTATNHTISPLFNHNVTILPVEETGTLVLTKHLNSSTEKEFDNFASAKAGENERRLHIKNETDEGKKYTVKVLQLEKLLPNSTLPVSLNNETSAVESIADLIQESIKPENQDQTVSITNSTQNHTASLNTTVSQSLTANSSEPSLKTNEKLSDSNTSVTKDEVHQAAMTFLKVSQTGFHTTVKIANIALTTSVAAAKAIAHGIGEGVTIAYDVAANAQGVINQGIPTFSGSYYAISYVHSAAKLIGAVYGGIKLFKIFMNPQA
jgi:hypothetical protein